MDEIVDLGTGHDLGFGNHDVPGGRLRHWLKRVGCGR